MADLKEMYIFSPEQIVVPEDLIPLIKTYSKAVIRSNPENLISFSREYFEKIIKSKAEASPPFHSYVPQVEDEEPGSSTAQFTWSRRLTNEPDNIELLNDDKTVVVLANHKNNFVLSE